MNNSEISKQLREIIRILERKIGLLEESEVSCCGISMAQCHALVEIGRAKSISLINLAKILNLDNSTMSRTVNILVNNGLVYRVNDPKDRRYIAISLTYNGNTLFNVIEDRMENYFKEVCNAIEENKRQQVLESLQVFTSAINKVGKSNQAKEIISKQ